MFRVEENRLVFTMGTEKLWIEPWGENSLRVRATRLAEMPQRDWALLPASARGEFSLGEEQARVKCGQIEARISREGKLAFFSAQGELLLEEYVRNRKHVTKEFASALCIDARELKPVLGGDYSLTMRFESDPEERIYGMGQYQQPFLNLKGCTLELAQRNSQASVPFLISDKGYGLLWHNPAVGTVNFSRNITTWQAASTDILDYWVTCGDTPDQIERQYARATGTAPMMPDFAMGFWQCKLRYQTQEELLSVAREYHRRGVPVSVIVVDFFHWTDQGDWKFDPEFWPDPDAMIRELSEMGMKLMVSVWPTVSTRSENFREMDERGLLISVDRGVPAVMTGDGNVSHFDATNPEARAYVWDKVRQNYYDKGVRVFWLDEAEPEYSYYDFDLYRYHLGPNLKIGNIYPQLLAKGFYDGMTAEGQKNVLNLLRCAWAGSQRYGALVWSGDIHSSFKSMKNQFCAGLNMALAGIPWWTTDIGGFHGGGPGRPEFPRGVPALVRLGRLLSRDAPARRPRAAHASAQARQRRRRRIGQRRAERNLVLRRGGIPDSQEIHRAARGAQAVHQGADAQGARGRHARRPPPVLRFPARWRGVAHRGRVYVWRQIPRRAGDGTGRGLPAGVPPGRRAVARTFHGQAVRGRGLRVRARAHRRDPGVREGVEGI